MSVSVRAAAGLSAWRITVIGLVAALSAGIGLAAGTFLLQDRSGGFSSAAAYVPADAPFYVEIRLEPSPDQDAALRELLGRFPPIEGLDLDRPLYDQLGELMDEQLAAEADVALSWDEDVASWFDGRLALGVTELPLDAMAGPIDPMAEPPIQGMIMVLGARDADAARAAIDRIVAEAPGAGELEESEHRGVTIRFAAADDVAFAVTDDAVLLAPTADDIREALDTAAEGGGRLADSDGFGPMVAELPADWLAFVAFDMTEPMAASFAQAAEAAPEAAAAMESLLAQLPMRGAMAITASGDRIAFEGVSEPPSGPFALENADRGLAAEVPGDALYFADGGNIGAALAAFVEAVKSAAAEDPIAADEIATAESALGAELEELVAWIDDGALVAGWDGSEPYAGLVLVPNDVDAAERRIGQLVTFAGLAGMDPASGVSVEEAEVAGTTVTTIRWEDPNAMPMEGMPLPTGIAVQVAVTDDRAVIGLGERFVARVLELDGGDSLGSEPRYAEAVAELGPTSNAGVAWLDVRGLIAAVETAAGPMLEMFGMYETDIRPWLAPLDRLVSVSVVEGELLLQQGAILFE